jgi:hypothetical protein
MTVKFTNNASSTLASAINTTATSLTVADASTFPSLSGADDYCYLTIQQATGTVREVVKATARSGNNFTIQRAFDNTTARAFSASDIVELRMTAALLQDVIDQATVEGIKTNYQFVPTAGQTQFSGADNSGDTLVINDAELVNVYMNGVRLVQGSDYTVSSSNNRVTLTTGATTADIIDIEVFGNFTGQSGAAVGITGGAISGTTITTGSINNTPIGATQANTVAATTLTANSALLGKSSSSFTTAGVELNQGGTAGKVQIQRASSPLALSNLTNDGTIIGFYKSTALVGTIATTSNRLSIGSNDVGIFFDSTNERLTPIDQANQVDRDAAIDLGYASSRFRHLFLSGIVTVGDSLFLQPDGSNDLIKSTGGVLYVKANEYSFQNNSGSVFLSFNSSGNATFGGSVSVTGSGNTALAINTGNNSGDNSQIKFGDSADDDVGQINYDHQNNKFQFRTNGGANSFELESNGNPVFKGINHTNVQVKSGDDSVVAFLQTVQGSDARFGTSTNHPLNIATNGQFAVTVDTNQNVIVGGTSAGDDGAVSISNTGYIQARINNDTVAYFDRTGSGAHGEIVRLQQNGATVGSISTLNGMLAIGNDNVFLNIDGGSGDYIYPMSSASGGASNGVVTLGFEQRRFKDLHLSGVAYASQIQATNSNGSNGTTTAQYAVIGLSSGTAQATIGSHHLGDGYANLNLGSTVSGDRKMWHISKRISGSSTQNRLEFFWYESGGFNSRFQFETDGAFQAVDRITSNKGIHGTSVNNVDDGLVVKAGSGDSASSRGRFSNNAADVAIGRNIATFPGTWTKADNSVASGGWVFGTSGAAAFYQSNAGDTTPLANQRFRIMDGSNNGTVIIGSRLIAWQARTSFGYLIT